MGNLFRPAAALFLLLGTAGSQAFAQIGSVPSKSDVFRVGKDVSFPSVLSKLDPAYTDAARQAKISGTVLLSAVIGSDGVAHNLTVVRGLGYGLDESAVSCVRQWKFAPGKKDGVPVNVMASLEINFRLLDNPNTAAAVPLNATDPINTSLPAPRLLSPLDNATFDVLPRLTALEWTESPGAESYLVEWDYGTDRGWNAEAPDHSGLGVPIKGTHLTINFPGAQPGRWRVWPIGKDGQRGISSEWRLFRYLR